MKKRITKLLVTLNVSPSIKGFYFIRDALEILNSTTEDISITQDLYPAIAKLHNTTANRVERVIRHAIATAELSSESDGLYFKLFTKVSRKTSLPTNSHFLYTLLLVVNDELEVKF